MAKIRFPNESDYIEIPNFNWNEFVVKQIFDDCAFGWYDDIYICILKDKSSKKELKKI